jgi:hypothetical protein
MSACILDEVSLNRLKSACPLSASEAARACPSLLSATNVISRSSYARSARISRRSYGSNAATSGCLPDSAAICVRSLTIATRPVRYGFRLCRSPVSM